MAESIAAPLPRKIGWYYGWNIVGLGVIVQMAALGLPMNCVSLFLQGWSREFHAPVSLVALAVTVFSVTCAPFSPIAGWAADRFPIRRVMGAGILLVVICDAAVASAFSAVELIVVYGLLAVGITFCTGIPCAAVVSRWFVRRRGVALGLSAFGVAAAGVALPPLVVASVHAFGWRATWWGLVVLLAAVILPLYLLFVRDRPRPRDSTAYVGVAKPDAVAVPKISYGDILRRRNFWLVGLGFFLPYLLYTGVITNLAPIATHHGFTLAEAALLLSAASGADLLAKLVAGAAADRFGNRIPLMAMCALGGLAAVAMAFAQGAVMFIPAVVVLGAVGAIWTLLASGTAAEFGQEAFGKAYGLICLWPPFGAISAPILAWTEEQTGSYTIGLVGLGALSLLGAILVLAMKPQPHRHILGADATA